jgi:hypothetical protein
MIFVYIYIHIYVGRRDPAIRIHLHRDVLHIHLLLELQVLLRLRLHLARLHNLTHRVRLCLHCHYVLFLRIVSCCYYCIFITYFLPKVCSVCGGVFMYLCECIDISVYALTCLCNWKVLFFCIYFFLYMHWHAFAIERYFLLNAEDYRWPWFAFLSSASTSVYVIY